jgi:signal recognition particle subunit SRP54
VFESLTQRLQAVFNGMSRRGTLKPSDIDAALREMRLALLEADVHYTVVSDLLARVREHALGEEVSRALNPTQQVVKILHAELERTLGEPGRLRLTGPTPRVVLLAGLQGSGKTTTAAKLARLLRSSGERVALLAADPYRPAAVEQLRILAEQLGVALVGTDGQDVTQMAQNGLEAAKRGGITVLIVDSAGRSQLDEGMMSELGSLSGSLRPSESVLVADAMTGQEAVHIASTYHQRLNLTGLILTKMDGDARGGAAISMRSVTGVPIKFLGIGESLEALEPFEPARLASRILGMGDVLTLIERAEASVDLAAAETQAQRLVSGDFTLEDFAEQILQVRKMGPIGQLMDMLPGGLGNLGANVDPQEAERHLGRTLAIIRSMTPVERRRPDILNASRKRRVAAGSGTQVQEVNQLLKQFRQIRSLMKSMGGRGKGGGRPRLRWPGLG